MTSALMDQVAWEKWRGPVDNPDLLSKPQGCPHLGAPGRAGTCWSFGPGIAADVPALFLS